MKKRILSSSLALVLLLSSAIGATASESYNSAVVTSVSVFTDIPDDYSTDALLSAIENGLLTGSNGLINPDSSLTRAEMATILVRAFGAENEATINFDDVSLGDWYYDYIAKSVQMGAFTGTGSGMNPNNYITRQEAFLVLSRVFALSSTDDTVLDDFADFDEISSWAVSGVASMVEAGYVQGSNGNINPLDSISRKDFAVTISRMVSDYISTSGTFNYDFDGNVMINTADVTLKDTIIDGDLIIGDGVLDGDITLDNVTITGTLLVRGGGENSITIKNSTISKITANKVENPVRIYIEDSKVTDVDILETSDKVILEGAVTNLTVNNTAGVELKSATVENLEVTVEDAYVYVDTDSSITDKTVSDDATVEYEEVVVTTPTTSTGSTSTSSTTYYYVYFDDADGNDETSVASQKIKKGNTADEPEAITRDGYTFIAWFDGDELFDFTTAINSKTYLTAVWGITTEAQLIDAVTTAGTVYIGANIQLTDSLVINEDVTLVVTEDTTLTINDGVSLTINGTLVNNGTIVNNGTVSQDGTITVFGESDLKAAFATGEDFAFGADITVNSGDVITNEAVYNIISDVEINGGGFTLTVVGNNSNSVGYNFINVKTGATATIYDLTILNDDQNGDYLKNAINIYTDSTDVANGDISTAILTNVTIRDFKGSAIMVNNSGCVIEDVTTSGNAWYAIAVSVGLNIDYNEGRYLVVNGDCSFSENIAITTDKASRVSFENDTLTFANWVDGSYCTWSEETLILADTVFYTDFAAALESGATNVYIANDITVDTITVPVDTTLTVMADATLTVTDTLILNGALVNYGTLNVSGEIQHKYATSAADADAAKFSNKGTFSYGTTTISPDGFTTDFASAKDEFIFDPVLFNSKVTAPVGSTFSADNGVASVYGNTSYLCFDMDATKTYTMEYTVANLANLTTITDNTYNGETFAFNYCVPYIIQPFIHFYNNGEDTVAHIGTVNNLNGASLTGTEFTITLVFSCDDGAYTIDTTISNGTDSISTSETSSNATSGDFIAWNVYYPSGSPLETAYCEISDFSVTVR